MHLKRRTVLAAGIIVTVLVGILSINKSLRCLAGGGGSTHVPPIAEFGKPTELELELSRWSAPECMTGQTSAHYTEVKCHYRSKGDSDFTSVPMEIAGEETRRAFYKCYIPAIANGSSPVKEIEYFFDFKFDGIYNRRNEKNLVITY
jgi:hypothetical protein